jgi:hypothetical protein
MYSFSGMLAPLALRAGCARGGAVSLVTEIVTKRQQWPLPGLPGIKGGAVLAREATSGRGEIPSGGPRREALVALPFTVSRVQADAAFNAFHSKHWLQNPSLPRWRRAAKEVSGQKARHAWLMAACSLQGGGAYSLHKGSLAARVPLRRATCLSGWVTHTWMSWC